MSIQYCAKCHLHIDTDYEEHECFEEVIEKKVKTTKQQDYHKRRCTYCSGSGIDTFNKSEPCPNCSKDPAIVNTLFKDCHICGRQTLIGKGCDYCQKTTKAEHDEIMLENEMMDYQESCLDE